MPRDILDETRIHPAIRDVIAASNQAIVREVQQAASTHPLLVVGMKHNPFPRKALKALQAAGFNPHYLEYGNYWSQWRRRNALKMWTGWPTFPMVFVKGTLVGGCDDTIRLIDSGELSRLLA